MSVNVQNKKKIAIGAAAVAAAAVTLGAGTFAFFSSTGTATDTTAAAGTLQIGQTETESVTLPPFAPGGTVERTFKFSNTGSLDGNLSLSFAVAGTEDGCHGDEPKFDTSCDKKGPGGQLIDKLQVKISDDHGNTAYDGSVSSLTAKPFTPSKLVHGNSVTYTLEFTFPNSNDASDNAAQGDTAMVSTTATLAQP